MKLFRFIMFTGLMTLFMLSTANATLIMTIEDAGVANTQISGAIEETFDDFGAGYYSSLDTAIGKFSGTIGIKDANVWGGAEGTGNYLDASGGISLDYTADAQGYLGFWWSAGNAGNTVKITTVGGDIYTFDTNSVINSGLLTQQHYGNPFIGGASGEPFAYINFFADNELSKIASVYLSGGGFESDNYAVFGGLTDVSGTVIQEQGASTPEPATIFMLGTGIIGLARARRRMRRN